MRYLALATDYDGTIAHDGIVHEETIAALKRLRESGRKLILVTGRQLSDLFATFSGSGIFDWIVAENGAVIYQPETKKQKILAEAPSQVFINALQQRGVEPLAIGDVIVATWDSQKEKVLDAIQEQGIECQIIFNKGALMVLPSGVNKATGFQAALEELGLSAHNAVGVGDAENDHAFLNACEASVAVANALPSLKERADLVTKGVRGDGVQELIEQLIENDLASVKLHHRDILLGARGQDEIKLPAFGLSLMVAGTSGGGKSTLTTGIMERFEGAGYQLFALDPEGDYQSFPGAVVLGDAKKAPTRDEILALLAKPDQNVVANLLGVALEQRPQFLQGLLPRLMELRAQTGRPHLIVIDEAHHLLPAERKMADSVIPKDFNNFMLITMEPDHVDPAATGLVDRIIAVGQSPGETITKFASVCGGAHPQVPDAPLEKGQAMMWARHGGEPVVQFEVSPSSAVSARHSRKYATAELTPDRSFFFRGPEGKLNLRAQNLMIFLQTMDGVDDETWLFHFRKGEYSNWFRENIKSDSLADATAEIERNQGLSAEESRKQVREQIEQRYTLPA